MPFNLKVSGVWKAANVYLRVAGAWKLTNVYLKVAGVWKLVSQLWSPPGGSYNDSQFGANATITLTCSVPATWTYVLAGGGSPGGSVNQASGYVGTSITFTQTPGASGVNRHNSWTVQGNVSGFPTENWTVSLDAENP